LSRAAARHGLSGTPGKLGRALAVAGTFLVALVFAGCGGTAPSGQPVSAPPGSGGSAWDQLVAAAKREGKVVVKGPPTAAVRTELPAAFRQRFGIEMEYVGGPSGEAVTQMASERKAGLYSTDVVLSGADSMYTGFYGQKMLDPLKPALVLADALDASKWPDGQLWFMDPEGQYILRLNASLNRAMQINTEQIKPGMITSWRDLLKPEFAGKIGAFDPSVSGAGLSDAAYLINQLGIDFARKLYVEQKPAFTRDHRELADWLARGKYPVAMSLREVEFQQLKKDKFPVDYVLDLQDASGQLSGGFGLLALMNNAPHPNAAKVVVNWLASKDGMETWSKAQFIVPVRLDTDKSIYPKEYVPDPGKKYFDGYGWDWVLNQRQQTMAEMQKLLR